MIGFDPSGSRGFAGLVVADVRTDDKVFFDATSLVDGSIIVRASFTDGAANVSSTTTGASAIMDTSIALEGLSTQTEDHREAERAFAEKRPPSFVGRHSSLPSSDRLPGEVMFALTAPTLPAVKIAWFSNVTGCTELLGRPTL